MSRMVPDGRGARGGIVKHAMVSANDTVTGWWQEARTLEPREQMRLRE